MQRLLVLVAAGLLCLALSDLICEYALLGESAIRYVLF